MVLGPDSVRMVELGHPWIIADSYTKKWRTGPAGGLIHLVDQGGRFLASALHDPGERVVARIISRTPLLRIDIKLIEERLTNAIRLRQPFINTKETTAYRLVNGEGDLLPGITIDRYGDYLMIQFFGNVWKPHLKPLSEALTRLLKPVGIYEKSRPQGTRELEASGAGKNFSRVISGKGSDERLIVSENGLSYLVSLEKGLDAGLFMDQRKNRLELVKIVGGKRFLNLFSYTGAFSVAAAAAGAKRVTSVDASSSYIGWSKENFRLNHLDPASHEFVVADCFDTLSGYARDKRKFDIILMDPPSFSTTSKSRFTTKKGTSELVESALPLLVDGGILICSSNHQKVDISDYLKEIRRGALKAGCNLQVLSLAGQPEDFPYTPNFPEGRYLKYVTCIKQGEVL